MRNGVQLITYVDRLGGGDLTTIRELLTGSLDGVFTGVHLLPFYRPYDRADAGFDPIDHRAVDPRLGDWDRVRAISETHDVTADLIVNHISDESPQFRDFLQKGDGSRYSGMFLEYDEVFPHGATSEELLRIYRPRPQLPLTTVTLADGTKRLMWTTFTKHQIDLDVRHPEAWAYLSEILDRLALAGVRQVRLDAIGYAIKSPGTSSFMTAETYRFIERINGATHDRGMETLLEVHSHHSDQMAAAQSADRVYDFALPPLVLHGLYSGSAVHLRAWLEIAPRNAITVLDTHDGIGIVDVAPDGDRPGLLTGDQVDELVEGIHRASGGQSRLATGEAASNLDLYQVNCTFFSALGNDPNSYLLARLLHLLSPGIPQVYYAGLLAASNDMSLLNKTGVGRDINRPYYQWNQLDDELGRPVVRRLMAMCRFRNTHEAFGGEFRLGGGDDHTISMIWEADHASVQADIDLRAKSFYLRARNEAGDKTLSGWDEF